MTEIDGKDANAAVEDCLPLEKILEARLVPGDIVGLAELMRSLDVAVCEKTILLLMERAEDKALGVLLAACAVNRTVLDPELLAETLKVVEPIFIFPLQHHGRSAV